MDWVYNNQKQECQLAKIRYAFARKAYLDCPRYWDPSLKWHKGKFHPEYFVTEEFCNDLKVTQK